MMSYAAAVDLLVRDSGWKKADVERDPDSAAWKASERIYQARDVVRAANAGMR